MVLYVQGEPDADDTEPAGCEKANQKAAVTVDVGIHHICYYEATDTKPPRFEATCMDEGHKVWDPKVAKWRVGRCRLTRFLSEESMSGPSGRPLGLMVAWLRNGQYWTSFEEHTDKLMLKATPFEQRQACREWLRTAPNGARLLSMERPRAADEKFEEPEECP